jgi:hypothetical protein
MVAWLGRTAHRRRRDAAATVVEVDAPKPPGLDFRIHDHRFLLCVFTVLNC